MLAPQSRVQPQVVCAFLAQEAGSCDALVNQLRGLNEEGLLALAQRAASPEDRLAVVLRVLPSVTAIRLACDYAEHALTAAAGHQMGDLLTNWNIRNEEALQQLRKCVDGCGNPEMATVVASWAEGCGYTPAVGPGIRAIAKALHDPPEAARHCFRAAKQARQYYALGKTEYPMHVKHLRKAEREELEWQILYARKVLATVADNSTPTGDLQRPT